MGAVGLKILHALDVPSVCNNCSKFVLNDMKAHSECCKLCSCDLETEKIDIPDEEENEEIVVEGCCSYSHSE